jgi:hypothetical protein
MQQIKERVFSLNDATSFVRDLRNYEIKKLLDDARLRAYLSERYQIENLSKIKTTFMWKSLKELQIKPVDWVHYSPILLTLQEDPDHEAAMEYCLTMVHAEIFASIKHLL